MPLLTVQRGHCFRTRGATGGPHEQQVAVAVAAEVVRLAPKGWQVRVIDADEPTSRYAGDAFVSLHCDASPDSTVRGASVGYRTTEGRALAAAWKAAYANCGWPGLFRGDNYTAALAGYYGTGHAVRTGNRRAVIVEQGFTTNPAERAWLLTPGGQRASARAIVWAVTGVDPAAPAPPTVHVPLPSEEDDVIVNIEGSRTAYHLVGGALYPLNADQAEDIGGHDWRGKVKTLTAARAADYTIVDRDAFAVLGRLSELVTSSGRGKVTSVQGLVFGSTNAIDVLRAQGHTIDTTKRTSAS